MLRQQNRFFHSVLIFADGVVVIAAVVVAYAVRFQWLADFGVVPAVNEPITFATHSIHVLVALPAMLLAMWWAGLYLPRRDQRFHSEAIAVFKAVVVGVLVTVACISLLRNVLFNGRHLSGLQYICYSVSLLIGLLSWRYSFRTLLRRLRHHGWNLRHVVIIGTGRLGQVVARTLMRNSWTGIKPAFFISHHPSTHRTTCVDLPVLGGLKDLQKILDEHETTGVFIALPGRMTAELPGLLSQLARFPLDVRVVPDMNPNFMPINMAVHELEGMPILSVRESPLNGWGKVTKRSLDLVGAVAGLLIFGIPMLFIAVMVRLSGPGPVVFRQHRMSLNGRRFEIFKFRTMIDVGDEQQTLSDADAGTEAWTKHDDPRVTRFGRFLRRTSLDELPQLFNVLLGEMSLVGPRPERPELIGRFREDWRGYMLRQNVKAGMTGWAQVNGLRGDTSLKKRLQYDLFYVRNWSIMFDLRILWMTIFRGFIHANAH